MTGRTVFIFIQLFAADIINWDREQERKQRVAAEECQDGVLIGDDPECQIIEQTTNLASSHGLLAQDLTRRALNAVMPRLVFDKRSKAAGNAANIVVAELSQLVEARRESSGGGGEERQQEEARLHSFLHYLLALKVRDEVVRRAMLAQVAHSGLQTASEAARLVVQEARDLLASESTPEVHEESKQWHRAYHNFRYFRTCEYM